MKKILTVVIIALCSICAQQTPTQQAATSHPDSLAVQLQELREKYRPGLGEIMGGIQMHHAKLWYAGINNNWKLADYEIAEIRERFEKAAEIETNHPEVKSIHVVYPPIDSVVKAIRLQNLSSFKSNFQLLTNRCNSCHADNHYEFIVISTPTAPPVSNQDFKVLVK